MGTFNNYAVDLGNLFSRVCGYHCPAPTLDRVTPVLEPLSVCGYQEKFCIEITTHQPEQIDRRWRPTEPGTDVFADTIGADTGTIADYADILECFARGAGQSWTPSLIYITVGCEITGQPPVEVAGRLIARRH